MQGVLIIDEYFSRSNYPGSPVLYAFKLPLSAYDLYKIPVDIIPNPQRVCCGG
jgi:hypothetical protein